MTAKLAYLMRHDNEFNADTIRELICDLFASSFESDCGSTPEVADALAKAIYRYRVGTEDDDDLKGAFVADSREAETYFCKHVARTLTAHGWPASAMDDYAVWPDVLSVESPWEKQTLRELALIQAGHDMIVRDQLKRLWEEEAAKEKAAADADVSAVS